MTQIRSLYIYERKNKKDFFFILYCFFFVPILLSDLRKPQMGLKLKKSKGLFRS